MEHQILLFIPFGFFYKIQIRPCYIIYVGYVAMRSQVSEQRLQRDSMNIIADYFTFSPVILRLDTKLIV